MTQVAPHLELLDSKNSISLDSVNVEGKTGSKQKTIFTYEPEKYQAEFEKNGYVLIKNGVDSEFITQAISQAEQQRQDQSDMKNWHFNGKKRQYLYDFNGWDFYSEGIRTLARTAQLPESQATLCERHVKVYEPDAKPSVPPHKDRAAAELTVGIPLFIPQGSHLVLWPEHHLEINTLESAATWRNSLDEEALPENILAEIEPVRLFAEPGDVVMFRGNTIYHERELPANASLLYLKLNGLRLDPLGEDPSTLKQQKESQRLLAQLDDTRLLDARVEISPRLEKISRHYSRFYWKEIVQAYVAGEKEFTLSEHEFELFRKIEGRMTVRTVLTRLGLSAGQQHDHLKMVRRLVRLKGLDILA